MTATAPLTCTALYAYDDVFRSAIAKWVADRRCPIELADYLRERELHAAADCAEWCATEPDRDVYDPLLEHGEAPGFCGPFPTAGELLSPAPDPDIEFDWYWVNKDSPQYARDVRGRNVRSPSIGGIWDGFYIVADAIIWLLDNWNSRT